MALEGVPRVGEIIESKYEIEHVLGVGGMGVVVAARHVQLGQRVAIKFLRGMIAEEPTAIDRFLREARAAVSLSSDHVTRVIDVGTLPTGTPYIIMEYLSGVDLGEVLRQYGPIPIGHAVNTVLQACEAIAEAHSIGIVHRDLKPANLFVSKRVDGSPFIKVLDFGISKRSDFDAALGRRTLTPSGHLMGSPAYMSPEQVRSPKSVDARTDIWALGVILYEILTGISPFAGETVGGTLAKIVSEPAAPIQSFRPEIPDGLAAVIAQCLATNPEQRIRTVGELAVKLSPFAPHDSAASVERIVRISGGIGDTAVNMLARSEISGNQRFETGPQWVRSGANPATTSRISRSAIVMIGAAVGLTAVGAIAGVYLRIGRNPNAATAVGTDAPVAATAAATPAAAAPPINHAPEPAPTLDPVQALPIEPEERADAGGGFPFALPGENWEPPRPKKLPMRPAYVRPAAQPKPTVDPADRLLEQRQ
jgi:serine/threonine-protein kinase